MEISFATDRLRKDMVDQKSMVRRFGPERSARIQDRLADLEAVEVLSEMRGLPGNCEELKGDRKGQLSVRLGKYYRLIFEPNDNPPALKEDGGIEWAQVRSIQFLEVVDYH